MSKDHNLHNARVVITGASSGIGAAAAELFAQSGAQLVLVGRDPDRTRQTARQVGAQALICDFGSLAEVRSLAATLGKELGQIDILINNAGGYWPSRHLSEDSLEMTMQVNALAPWLLTRDLLPNLDGGRVVSTTSILGLRTRRGDVLAPGRGPRLYEAWDVYAASKLALSLMVREFDRRNQRVQFCDVNPGFVSTGLTRNSRLHRALTRTPVARVVAHFQTALPDAGAALLAAATEPIPPTNYFSQVEPSDPGSLVTDTELAAQVWDQFTQRSAANAH